MLRASVSGLAAVLLLAAVASAQDAARGDAVLLQAREALGGASRLAAVRTLHVEGTFRRVVGGADTEGDFEVFVEVPDKYLRSEKTGTPGQPSTETIEALIAGEPRDVVRGGGRGAGFAPGGDAPGGGDDQADGPGPGAALADAAAPPAARGRGPGVEPDALRRARQAEVSRLLLMWLLRSEEPLTWIGVAESPDGTADVLEARYADGQPTRLFVESTSRLPLMMQWLGQPARIGGRGGRRGGGPAGPSGPAQPVTLDMTFSDHRAVNGIRLPHVITRGMNGETTERWTIRRYRVNPSINAETFTP